jgi:hypothetical protein
MKNRSKILKIGILSILVSFISCTDNFEDINKDPNAFNEVSAETLIVGSMKTVLDVYGGLHNLWYCLNSSRHMGDCSGNEMMRYGFNEGHTANYWSSAYYGIKNCQEIIDGFSDDPEYTNRVAMARIWQATIQSYVVGSWGPCPMSMAGTGEPTIPYDSEEEIYTAILQILKDAAAAIDPAGDSFYDDPLFDGDISKWVKFANTMRLKIALRASESWPTLASTHGQEVMANDAMLINTNSEEASLQWGTTSEDWSYYYNNFIFEGRTEYIPKMNHMFMLFMKTYNDPRMKAFAEPAENVFVITEDLADAEGSATTVSVTYGIEYVGGTVAKGASALDEWNLNAADNPFQGFDDADYSFWNQANFMQPDMEWTIQSAADSKLCQAEAALKGWGGSKSAQAYYEEGIDLSFAKWGYAGQSAAYKAQDGIAWGTSAAGVRNFQGTGTSAISSDPLEKIAVQRWMNGFPYGFDTWCMQRRTRVFSWPAHFNTAESTGERFMDIQERVRHSNDELSLNTDAYNAAIATMGPTPKGDNLGDVTFTMLEFAKPYTWYDWATYPDAEYNLEWASQFYGDSVDDLEAAGKKLRTTPVTPDNPLKRDEYIIN